MSTRPRPDPHFWRSLEQEIEGLVERLNVSAASTNGNVFQPWPRALLTEAAQSITRMAGEIERLTKERDEAVKSIGEMAERFRAVNVSEAVKQTIGENVFALRERAETAESALERLRGALTECAAPWMSPPTTVSGAAHYVSEEFQRRMNLARAALAEPVIFR